MEHACGSTDSAVRGWRRCSPLRRSVWPAAAATTGANNSTAASAQEQTSTACPHPRPISAASSSFNTNTAALTEWTGRMDAAAQEYLTLAEGANRDYAQLLEDKPEETKAAVTNLRELWVEGNPLYERNVEGIVAGVPSLADVDVILDAGTTDGGEPRRRRALRPRARRRPRAQQAGQPVRRHRDQPLGHAAPIPAKGVAPDVDGTAPRLRRRAARRQRDEGGRRCADEYRRSSRPTARPGSRPLPTPSPRWW